MVIQERNKAIKDAMILLSHISDYTATTVAPFFSEQTLHAIVNDFTELRLQHQSKQTIICDACKAEQDLANGVPKGWSMGRICTKEDTPNDNTIVESNLYPLPNWCPSCVEKIRNKLPV